MVGVFPFVIAGMSIHLWRFGSIAFLWPPKMESVSHGRLTKHPRGDEYLVGLAKAVDDLLAGDRK